MSFNNRTTHGWILLISTILHHPYNDLSEPGSTLDRTKHTYHELGSMLKYGYILIKENIAKDLLRLKSDGCYSSLVLIFSK